MNQRPRCSVIVPTYNRSRLLELTLQSLAEQSLKKDEYEVIVVDDGSSDDTAAVARSFMQRIKLEYVFQEDLGYRVAKARNAGIRRAHAPVCVFLDSGVIAHSACLAAHLETQSATASAAVCGYVYCFNEDNQDAEEICAKVDPSDTDGSMHRFEEEARCLDLRERFYQRYGDSFSHLPAPWVVYWTCNVSAKTKDLWQVGLFDEQFTSWGVEDIDLGYRLFRHGAVFSLNRRACAIHYPHEKSHSRNTQASKSNYEYFARKYGDPVCDVVSRHHFLDVNEVVMRGPLVQAIL